jgi:hypothetical protein
MADQFSVPPTAPIDFVPQEPIHILDTAADVGRAFMVRVPHELAENLHRYRLQNFSRPFAHLHADLSSPNPLANATLQLRFPGEDARTVHAYKFASQGALPGGFVVAEDAGAFERMDVSHREARTRALAAAAAAAEASGAATQPGSQTATSGGSTGSGVLSSQFSSHMPPAPVSEGTATVVARGPCRFSLRACAAEARTKHLLDMQRTLSVPTSSVCSVPSGPLVVPEGEDYEDHILHDLPGGGISSGRKRTRTMGERELDSWLINQFHERAEWTVPELVDACTQPKAFITDRLPKVAEKVPGKPHSWRLLSSIRLGRKE